MSTLQGVLSAEDLVRGGPAPSESDSDMEGLLDIQRGRSQKSSNPLQELLGLAELLELAREVEAPDLRRGGWVKRERSIAFRPDLSKRLKAS